MASLDSLSDAEIRSKLAEYGFDGGPVNPATRKVYLKKLKSFVEGSSKPIDVTDKASDESASPASSFDSSSDNFVTGSRKEAVKSKSPSTRRKSPARKPEVHPPLASSTFVEPVPVQSPPSRTRRTWDDENENSNKESGRNYAANFNSQQTDEAFVSPRSTYLSSNYPQKYNGSSNMPRFSNVGSSEGLIFRSKMSSPVVKDFDSNQPYSSDYTRHLSSLYASRVAASSGSSRSNNYDDVKESEDEDEGSQPTYSKFGYSTKGSSTRGNGVSYPLQEGSWFGRDASAFILALLVLFFLAIAYTYFYMHHSDNSVATHISELNYPRCTGDSVNNCIPDDDIKQVSLIFKLVNKELLRMGNEASCTSNSSPFLFNSEIIKLVNDKEKSISIWDIEVYVKLLKHLIGANPKWNMVDSRDGVRLNYRKFSYYCSVVRWIYNVFNYVLIALIVAGTVTSAYFGAKWYYNLKKRRQEEVYKLVSEILDVVTTKSSQDGYAVISHVRDLLIPIEERQKKINLWNEAEAILETDSRLRKEVQHVEGEDFWVWRWLASPAPLKRKGWQGQAFETMEGSVNSLPESPTPCLKIRHMFDPSQEDGDGWVNNVADAVLEKCRDAVIYHIAVDKTSTEGCVYVKCASQQDAGIAYRALHGFWFNSKLVTVKYIREARYLERFPEAGRLKYPLQLSSRPK